MAQKSGNRVYINSQGFIHINVVGKQTYDGVWQMGRRIEELAKQLKKQNKRVLIFDDLRQMNSNQTSDVRKAVAEVAKTIDFNKVAMVGSSNVLLKYGTNLMITAIGKASKIKYFDNANKATAWLIK